MARWDPMEKVFVAEQVAPALLRELERQRVLAQQAHPGLSLEEARGALVQARAEEPWAGAARALFVAEQEAAFSVDALPLWAGEVLLVLEVLQLQGRSERSMAAEEVQLLAQASFEEPVAHLWAMKRAVVQRSEPLFRAEVAWWAPADLPAPAHFGSRVCPLLPVRLRSRRSLAKVALQPVRPDGLHCQPRADATRGDLGSCKRGRMVFVGFEGRETAGERRVHLSRSSFDS